MFNSPHRITRSDQWSSYWVEVEIKGRPPWNITHGTHPPWPWSLELLGGGGGGGGDNLEGGCPSSNFNLPMSSRETQSPQLVDDITFTICGFLWKRRRRKFRLRRPQILDGVRCLLLGGWSFILTPSVSGSPPPSPLSPPSYPSAAVLWSHFLEQSFSRPDRSVRCICHLCGNQPVLRGVRAYTYFCRLSSSYMCEYVCICMLVLCVCTYMCLCVCVCVCLCVCVKA